MRTRQITYARRKKRIKIALSRAYTLDSVPPDAVHGRHGAALQLQQEADQRHDKVLLQTPHRTPLTEKVYNKAKTSESPNRPFSPVPNSKFCETVIQQGPSMGRSSSNLKENIIARKSTFVPFAPSANNAATAGSGKILSTTSGAMAQLVNRLPLASPFTSQPATPYSSPKNSPPSQDDERLYERLSSRPAFPSQAQSTANSPIQRLSSAKMRRPSAPSVLSQRPEPESWLAQPILPDNEIMSGFKPTPTLRTSSIFEIGGSVNFNRPPSQLSFIGVYDENFFDEIQGVSTPFNRAGNKGRQVSDDQNNEEAFGFTDDERALLASWVTDSIISPPTLYRSSKSKPSSSPDSPEITSELGSNKTLAIDDTILHNESADVIKGFDCMTSYSNVVLTLHSQDHMSAEQNEMHHSTCQDSPESPNSSQTKHLGPTSGKSHSSAVSTSSAGENEAHIPEKRTARDRRGTLRASDFNLPALAAPRRARSGTVLGPSIQRGPRNRSGTIKARPGPLSSKQTQVHEILGAPNSSPRLVEAFEDDLYLEGLGQVSEDTLLLREQWHEEEWVVAEPPSPVVPRRPQRKSKALEREMTRRKKAALALCKMKEHDEDDGTEDPLLLA